MNIEERFKWLVHGYTSHFKPLSTEVITDFRRECPGMEEIALHVNPIGYSEVRFILEDNGFMLEHLSADKPKANAWAYAPAVWLIRLVGKLASKQKQRQRWTKELNSDPVLRGGNTLIFKARKI
jgi:hypothetical protein